MELHDEPLILHVPDIHTRFFTVEIADAYTTNIPYVAGTHVRDGKGGDFAFVGPDGKEASRRASRKCASRPIRCSSRFAFGSTARKTFVRSIVSRIYFRLRP